MHDDLFAGNDVVREVRVERGADFVRSAFDHREETEKGSAIVGFWEPFSVHDSATLELSVWKQEAIRRHELHSRGIAPPCEECVKHAGRRRLADGYRTRDADDKRCACTSLAQKTAGGCVQAFGPNRVKADEFAQREVHL